MVTDRILSTYKVTNCTARKKEKVDKLPPCKSSLTQHYSRANYQWHVWGLSLEAFTTITSPQDYGWTIDTNGISIKWIFCKPAPEEIKLYSSANFLKLTCYYVHLFTEVITLAKFTEVITLAKFTEVIALVKFTEVITLAKFTEVIALAKCYLTLKRRLFITWYFTCLNKAKYLL